MAETVTMPKLGFDMAEGTLVRWVIQTGEPVQKGAVLAEIETDKATVEVESNFEGILAQQLVQAGDVVPVNTPIAVITAPGEKLAQLAQAAPAGTAPAQVATATAALSCASCTCPQAEPVKAGEQTSAAGHLPGNLKASPLARRMAADARINLELVPGSGPSGRIVQRDIKAYLLGAAPSPAAQLPFHGGATGRRRLQPAAAACQSRPASSGSA